MGTKAYDYDAAVKYLEDNYVLKPGYQEAMRLLNSGRDVIEDLPDPNDLMGSGFDYCHTIGIAREAYITKYGFVLVTRRMVRELAKVFGNDTVLEIMSGTGYLAYALQKEGVNVIATDNHSWDENVFHTVYPWVDLHDVDCLHAIEWCAKNQPEVRWVLMSWPPYQDPIACHVVRLLEEINNTIRKDNPINLLYIGEDEGGCTADYDFFELIHRSINQYEGGDENGHDKLEDTPSKVISNWSMDEDFTERAMYGRKEHERGFFREFNGIHDWPYVFRWTGDIYKMGLSFHDQENLNGHSHSATDEWVRDVTPEYAEEKQYVCDKCHMTLHWVNGYLEPMVKDDD